MFCSKFAWFRSITLSLLSVPRPIGSNSAAIWLPAGLPRVRCRTSLDSMIVNIGGKGVRHSQTTLTSGTTARDECAGHNALQPAVRVQPHKPAEQQVVIHLFHQQTLAAHRVQHLQQLRSQQLLRRNRRPPYAGTSRPTAPTTGSAPRPHGPDGAQRMVVSHPFLRRQVTEYMVLLIVRSSHASS